MSRLERLVNLTAALIDAERPLTREELRERVGGYARDPVAFRRNFERDKDLLRQMGMPVSTVAVDPGRPDSSLGYRIHRRDYELPDPGLAADELAALRLATSAVQVAGTDEATTSALRKLAGAPGPTTPGPGVLRPGPTRRPAQETATLPGGPDATAVFAAVAGRQVVAFDYRGERRRVDPWRMSYRNGQWYLSGHDHARNDARLFRLDRITGGVAAVGEPGAFNRPDRAGSGPAPPWQIGEDAPVDVTLSVDADHAGFALDRVGRDALVEQLPDGAVRLSLRVTNRSALRSLVLGFLDHAEVEGPPEVRAEVVAWLVAAADDGRGGDRWR